MTSARLVPKRGSASIALGLFIAAVFALALPSSGAAGSTTLRLGDAVRLAQTGVYCTVLRDVGITVLCFKGTPPGPNQKAFKPFPKSYGVTVSSRLASIVRFSSATQSRTVLTRKQPSAQGKTFPSGKKRDAMIFTLRFADRAFVGGTDIVCGVGGKERHEAIGCRESDAKLDSIAGTWGAVMDSGTASIARYMDKNDNISVAIIRNQP
jgi:hypothetical protein